MVESVGLRQAIDERVQLFKRHTAFNKSDHVLALIFYILTVGQSIDDLKRHRNNEAFLDALCLTFRSVAGIGENEAEAISGTSIG